MKNQKTNRTRFITTCLMGNLLILSPFCSDFVEGKQHFLVATRISMAAHRPAEAIPLVKKNRRVAKQDMKSDWSMGGGNAANTYCNLDVKGPSIPMTESWQTELGPKGCQRLEDIATSSGVVVVSGYGDGKYKIFGLDSGSGKHLWTFVMDEGGGANGCPPAIANGVVYCGGQSDDKVYAVSLYDGKLKWKKPGIIGMYDKPPKVVDDTLIVNSRGSGIWAFDAKSGEVKWNVKRQSKQSDMAIIGNRLFRPGGAYGDSLVAFDLTTGKRLWATPGKTNKSVAANHKAVFVCYTGDTAEPLIEKTPDGKRGFPRWRFDRLASFSLDGKKLWETKLKTEIQYGQLLLNQDRIFITGIESRESRSSTMYQFDATNGKILNSVEKAFVATKMVGSKDLIFAFPHGRGIVGYSTDSLKRVWRYPDPVNGMAVANNKLFCVSGSNVACLKSR